MTRCLLHAACQAWVQMDGETVVVLVGRAARRFGRRAPAWGWGWGGRVVGSCGGPVAGVDWASTKTGSSVEAMKLRRRTRTPRA
jgi:hypothetical protein